MNPAQEAELLAHLRRNGRKGLTELSRLTRIPVSTIFDRLKVAPSVLRNTVLLRFSRLGFSCKAFLLFSTTKPQKARLGRFLAAHPYMNTVHKINNGQDYCAEGIFLDMAHLESFLEYLEEHFPIRNKQVHYLLDELSRESFLSDPKMAGETLAGKAKHPVINEV